MEDETKEILSVGFLTIAGVLGTLLLLGILFRTVGREFQKYDEETRAQVVEQSRAYNEGMAKNLDKLCVEWELTNNAAVAQSIRHRASGYKGELPPHIQNCLDAARKVK